MVSRFRKELTVVPPVRIIFRERKLETTVDWSVSGADRALLNIGLRTVGDVRSSGPLPTGRYLIPGTRVDFGGGNVAAMTSSGLGDFKQLLLATHIREREIRTDIKRARLQHAVSWTARALTWSTLVPLIFRSIREKVDRAVAIRRTEIAALRDNLASSRISISFDMGTAVADPHRRMTDAFVRLAASAGVWALQTSQMINRVKARSMSNVVVARLAAQVAQRADPLVNTADLPPSFPVQNGRSTAYFYPGFVLVVDAARTDFAVIDLKEITVRHHPTRFTEEEKVPPMASLLERYGPNLIRMALVTGGSEIIVSFPSCSTGNCVWKHPVGCARPSISAKTMPARTLHTP